MAEVEDSLVRSAEINPQLKEIISRMFGGERLKSCYSCGACVGSCPVARILGRFRPSRIILESVIGLEEDIIKGEPIWDCTFCYICQDVCPKQVRFPEVLFAIRNLAARKGIIPKEFMLFSKSVYNNGRSILLDELILEDREDLGLPPLESIPPEKAISDVQKVMEITGFKKLVKLE